MSKKNKKLVIIDGNALVHRSFHALPTSLKAKDGTLTNAVYGFSSFLLKALNELKPDYAIVTFDRKEKTFRHEAYREYKATRIKAPDELYAQFPLVKKVVDSLSILSLEKAGFEADDLIGTISQRASQEKNIETIIITGDLDTLQLVNDKVKVYTMSRGLSDSVIYDKEKVQERYNLEPHQLIDFKSLRGDPSDNIPGVAGIGEKGAINLLTKFKSLEKVIEAAEKKDKRIKPRIADLIANQKEQAKLSYQLATIDNNVEIKFDWSKAVFPQFKTDEVFSLFSELGFKSLLEKVNSLKKKNQEKIEKKIAYKIIENDKDFKIFFKELKNEQNFSMLGHFNENKKMLGLAFSLNNHKIYYLSIKKNNEQTSLFSQETNLINDKNLNNLFSLLKEQNKKLISYDLKKLNKYFLEFKFLIEKNIFDTLIAAHLIEPDKRQNSFSNISFSFLGKNFADEKNDISNICLQAKLNLELYKILNKELKNQELFNIFETIEMPLSPILAKMEYYGIKLDIKKLDELSQINKESLNKLTKKIQKLANKKFNINSTKQLKEVLYIDLNISTEGIKKTKTGFSTAEEELSKIKNLHPIVPLLLEYRELFKLQTTYLEALPKLLNPQTKKIHTSWQQNITATGRLSSSEPNLQNIPTKTKRGRQIRSAFVAEKSYKLLGFDYSQIELRITAHLANDKKMIKAFLDKADIHIKTAAAINDISESEVSPQKRQEAKAVNFGIIYGQGPHGLSQAANISYYQAKEFIDRYFSIYPGVKKLMEKSIKQAQKNGYSSTILGRKRPLTDINSKQGNIRKSAERMAINTPIQGTAADIIKLAMIEIDKLLKNKENDIKLRLQIHDELIFSVKEDKITDYKEEIKKIMEKVIKLKVPILVQENVGNNWEELK
jgi:DNA polymerase I